MTTKTLGCVLAGVGLAAALVGVSPGAHAAARASAQTAASARVPELAYLPAGVAVVAYVDVKEVIGSDLWRRLQSVQPAGQEATRRFEEGTGIDLETDVDAIVAGVLPHDGETAALAIARGRFDAARIESYALGRGGVGETYKGVGLIWREDGSETSALAFLAPGLIATGESEAVRRAVDCLRGAANATANASLMQQIAALPSLTSAWAVGNLGRLASRATLPEALSTQMSDIEWFAASARLNGGVTASLSVEARDDESAGRLREELRGHLATARQQFAGKPEQQAVLDSIELGGKGTTVALSFSLPAELFDSLAPSAPQAPEP
jgi:hypothetical protein